MKKNNGEIARKATLLEKKVASLTSELESTRQAAEQNAALAAHRGTMLRLAELKLEELEIEHARLLAKVSGHGTVHTRARSAMTSSPLTRKTDGAGRKKA